LIALSAASRSFLGEEALAAKQRFDIPARLRTSLKQHPTGWLMGSLASGLAASLLFRREKPANPEKRRGLPTVLLGLTLTAVRPLAKVWLTNQVKHHLVGRFASTSSNPQAESRSPSSNSL